LIILDEPFTSKRYESPAIDLGNQNSSHSYLINRTGFDRNVLEIGTSTGYISKILKKNRNTVVGIEINHEAAVIAQQYCDRIIIGDIETLDLDKNLDPAIFDVILCGDVLEHLKKPAQILKKFHKFLKPEGYLVVSLPNFCHGDVLLNLLYGNFQYTDIGLLEENHLRFFGLKNIYTLFMECGYQITDLHTTNLEIGNTELRIKNEQIPDELLKFITSLPNSNVYQFIFCAYPSSEVKIPEFKEIDLNELFPKSLEESGKEQLREASARVAYLEQEIFAIKSSIIWQLAMKFHKKVVEGIISQNTRSRKFYDLGRAGGQILIHDGIKTFIQSVIRHFHNKNELNCYQDWIIKNEPLPDALNQLKKNSQTFSYRPKISIIIPMWNTDRNCLRLAIESLINQVYDNWELCIVAVSSTKRHIKRVLNEYSEKDSRIKVKLLGENKGITGNSNEALSLATGEFIGFLDHGDELAPFSLYEVVKLLNKNPNFHLIYSDEDKIDKIGNRKDPFFKPDWSPDLFLSQNYLCHLAIVRKKLIDSVGGFQSGYNGSQDYDLFLRVTEKIQANEIAHISKILYHRKIKGCSVANQLFEKPYAFISAKKALTDALTRRGIHGEILDGLFPGSYRIRYNIQNNPKVSIIIPTKDKVEILQKCILSILEKTTYQNYEIVIIDNQSRDDETFKYYNSLKTNLKIKILHYDNSFNFSAINNYAVDHVDSPYILFLNNDMEVISGEWLSAMLEHAQREGVGAVGAKLYYPNNTIQHAGVIIGLGGVAGHSHKHFNKDHPGHRNRLRMIQNFSAVTAACLLMRKNVFQEIGGFNEDLANAFNDVDLCLKIRSAGYLIIFTPYSQFYHHESISRGYDDTPEKHENFLREISYIREHWGTMIDEGDPYYNPNLTLKKEDFSIK